MGPLRQGLALFGRVFFSFEVLPFLSVCGFFFSFWSPFRYIFAHELFMELPCFDRGVRWAKMSSQPGCLPGGSGCARDEREACGGKAPGVDRCGNEGDVNGAYGTVAAAATAIGDATPAGSATVVNESEAVAAAATSQYLAALEESMEALWRHMGGSVRGSVAWRGDGGTMKTGTFAGQFRPK